MKPQRSKSLNNVALLEILALSQQATAIYTGGDIVIELANDEMLNIWGKDRSVIGLPLIEAIPELEGQEFISILQEVWRTGITYEAIEKPATLNVNGHPETFYFDFIYRAVKNTDGSMRCILHSAADVSDRIRYSRSAFDKDNELGVLGQEIHRYHEELRQANNELTGSHQAMKQLYDQSAVSENIFRSIFEQAPLGLTWLQGHDMVIKEANQPMLKIWGRTAEDVMGRPIRVARPELQGQPVLEMLHQVYRTGRTQVNVEFKVWLKKENGLREAYVNSTYSPVKNAAGVVTGVLVIVEEVTERVAERQRRELMEEQFRISVESAELGTWYVDADTREFVTSARLKEVFGYYPEDNFTLANAIAQIREDYREKVSDAIDAAIAHETSYNIEYPIIGYHDGKLRWIRATGKLYTAKVGTKPHFSGVITEITERKLEEIRKNDFIAIVSHELKTPLTSAKAFVQMLISKLSNSPDQFTYNALKKIEQQVEKMNALIKGFLDVARLESGKIQLNKQQFVINDLLRECAEEAGWFAQRHMIDVVVCDPILVEADRDKIGQVISNFLSNAIKYSPKGKHIEISCRSANSQVIVYVKDEGMGIKEQDKEKLFDRFYRVENKHTKTISGFGIGLFLCMEIIQLHHGEIGVESMIGHGSTFFFKIASLPAIAKSDQ